MCLVCACVLVCIFESCSIIKFACTYGDINCSYIPQVLLFIVNCLQSLTSERLVVVNMRWGKLSRY